MKIDGLKENNEHKDDFVDKNFLLVSLEENKAKKIAEVINNDTARKILAALAKKEYSESDLSKDLGIAISTIHYNLRQLMDANLVVVEEFHYSKKGKEINHYTLANKYIIIAPKIENSKFMEALKKVFPIAIISAGVALIMQLFTYLSKTASAAQSSAGTLARSAAPMMAKADNALISESSASTLASSVAGPDAIAYFLVGALAVVIIYFFYELLRKK